MDRPTIARRGSSPVSAGAGTAAAQGPLWGEHAGDWAAVQEPQLDAVYRAVLDALPVAGRRVLDIGCGAGRFLELAVAAGADVDGLDASPALVAEAHGRLPGARLVVGEMQRLPYADATFEVVTGFNTFQWAADRVAAIGEAARTLRPDGRLVVAVWGPPESTDAAAYLVAIDRLLPAAPADAPGSFALSAPGVLDSTLVDAGLRVADERMVPTEWRYPDQTTALRGLLSAGPAVRATAQVGEAAVIDAVISTLGSYRASGGGFRLRNQVRCVFAGR